MKSMDEKNVSISKEIDFVYPFHQVDTQCHNFVAICVV